MHLPKHVAPNCRKFRQMGSVVFNKCRLSKPISQKFRQIGSVVFGRSFCRNHQNEAPGWTQLKLPGQSPSPRCGHTVTSSGHYLLLFGGHGTGGWLSRYDVYHNDCIILDRVSVQWKRLPTNNEPPPPRAYHSMTSIGMRYLLFGGFDGKTTFGDLWWLVPEDDPIAKQLHPISNILPETKLAAVAMEDNIVESPINDLQKRIGILVSSSKAQANLVDELDDEELLELSSNLAGGTLPISDQGACIEALREHWKNSTATSIQLRELGPLLRDYQRFITHHRLRSFVSDWSSTVSDAPREELHRFFHLKSASQLRMEDVPKLLNEYQQLLRWKS